MTYEQSILTTVVALTDSVWAPYRWQNSASGKTASAISERRGEFIDRGVPYIAGGSAAHRKACERQLQDVADAGLLIILIAGKRVGVRLTDRGDDVARALTAGYSARESYPLLAQVARAAKAIGDSNAGFQWEGECIHPPVNNLERPTVAEARRVCAFATRALPLLARQWLESSSDSTGVVGYLVTEVGCTAKRPKSTQLPDYEPECGDEYDRVFSTALEERERWESRLKIVHIPLGAGSWPERRRQHRRA